MPKKIDTAGLKHFKGKENAMVASEFSASKSYAIGEYVYYKGTLYKFKAAHAAGAWTNADVDAVKLADDVSVLKESINDRLSWKPIIIIDFTTGKYINNRGEIGETLPLTYNNSDSYSCVLLDVNKGDTFKITGLGGNAARLWCLLDKDNKIVALADANVNLTGFVGTATEKGKLACNFYSSVTPSLEITRVISTDVIDNIETQITSVNNKADENSNELLKTLGGTITNDLTLVVGYVDYQNGNLSNYDDNNKYKRTNLIPIEEGTYQITTNCIFNAFAGWAVYDANQQFITGGNTTVIPVETTYKYVAVSSFDLNGSHQNKTISFLFKSVLNTVISCWGDSITEGMYLDGNHSAEYGKAPYPAQINTILTDKGYKDFTINNYGHGGECTPDIMARLGAVCALFTEDITVNGDGTPVAIGTHAESGGLRTDSKIQIPFKNKNNANYNVALTQLSHDTNPITINGNQFSMSISNQTIYISQNSGTAITIPKGSLMFTADNRDSTIDIVYCGVNDATSMTLEIYLKFMKKVAEKNPNYLCIGCQNALFQYWSDLAGTVAEKYATYSEACTEQMGVHFVDLYQEFYPVAIKYAREGGYFSGKTAEELATMEDLLAQKTMPAEFSYDDAHQGNVHLNAAGYYVIARIIYNRLVALNLI